MSMTLAPRRRPIFNQRGRHARDARRLGAAAALIVAVGVIFTVGLRIGSQTQSEASVKSVIAAYLQ